MAVNSKKPDHFKPSASAETQFARALRKVGRVSGHLVEAHVDGHELKDEPAMQAALKAYSKTITPWAKRQSEKMLAKVSKSNLKNYKTKTKSMLSDSNKIHKLLVENVAQSKIGRIAQGMMHEQVELITSIPLRAGMRAQKLALAAVINGTRASEIADELAATTDVSESIANTIARTEVARANASITQARAESVGATAYIWRTSMDGAERKSHAEMNGKYVLYSKVPKLSDGTEGHAGTLINCRCYQDVQFDD